MGDPVSLSSLAPYIGLGIGTLALFALFITALAKSKKRRLKDLEQLDSEEAEAELHDQKTPPKVSETKVTDNDAPSRLSPTPLSHVSRGDDSSPASKSDEVKAAAEIQKADTHQPAVEETSLPKASSKPERDLALVSGLSKTRSGWIARLGKAFAGKREIDPQLLEEIERTLFTADIGVRTSQAFIDEIKTSLSKKELSSPENIWNFLRERSRAILQTDTAPLDFSRAKPFVLLVIGVNGSGKTTTIGKLGSQLVKQGLKVLFAAGDTFRAAASEQLEIWGTRVGAPVVRGKEGADPSSVLFEAIKKGTTEGVDVVLCDTAGRLHTKTDLMEELQKLKRVVAKACPGAPHETWLVIDATSGQNAIAQAQIFTEAMAVSGVILTKLDGTAKGGVILGIADQLKLPVRYIGVGEKAEDLKAFNPTDFVDALFEHEATS